MSASMRDRERVRPSPQRTEGVQTPLKHTNGVLTSALVLFARRLPSYYSMSCSFELAFGSDSNGGLCYKVQYGTIVLH